MGGSIDRESYSRESDKYCKNKYTVAKARWGGTVVHNKRHVDDTIIGSGRKIYEKIDRQEKRERDRERERSYEE